MQPLVDTVYRSAYTAAQITALVQAPGLQVQAGLDLLDQNNHWLADISSNLVSWSLTRDNTATIHGTGTFVVAQSLQGGWQRVRPYMLLSGAGLSNVRWDLGVYVLTTPVGQLNEIPLTWTITGTDLLYLLRTPIGNTYNVPAGVTYLGAIQRAVSDAQMTGSQVLLDSSMDSAVVPVSLTFPLTGGQVWTYLDVINQLLVGINYIPLWADWEGNFRSNAYINPNQLQPEFTFDLTQPDTMVADPRTLTNDLWQAPNVFIYINQNVSAPVEGAGIYTYTNQSSGPSSVDSVGRYIPTVVSVSAADQATLQNIAQQAIQQTLQLTLQLAVSVSPFPACWHYDVFAYKDPLMPPGLPPEVVVQSQGWSLASDGSDGAQTWQVV